MTAHVCSTPRVRWMSSMVNMFSRMRERPSMCQTTREHANASIAPSAIRTSCFVALLTNKQTITRTSFLPHDNWDPSYKTCVLSQM